MPVSLRWFKTCVQAVGDRIPVNASGTEFVIVRRISDGQVTLDHRGRPIVVIAGRRR